MSDHFTTSVRREGGTGVIEIGGDLDGDADERLKAAYAEAGQGASALVLQFDGLAYMNSTGIALVVELLARARADGVAVRAAGLSDHYRQIFEITRLADFMEIEPAGTPAVG